MTVSDDGRDTIEPIAARHEAVIGGLTEAARADERVIAAWLQGSRADGSADAFSDIDYYVAVPDDAFNSFDKLEFVSRVAQVLVHVDLFGQYGVACLLEGPVKLDFFVERASAAENLPRPAVKLLLEKTRVMFKTGWEPSRQDVAKQVDSAIRTTLQGASWPVRLLRRGQWMTHAFSELTLIHNVIVPLMLVQHDTRAFHRNTMTRERLLTDEQRSEVDSLAHEVLTALAARSPEGSLRAHLRVVDVMGRVGRTACAAFDLEFPEAAEREARRLYEREWPGL
ncbi:MAG: nucleotidyltransferase domain-containing protein [Chloroflexi bacterium]|nr:nucleotidyltransferase domain-containing protein [Chloroflexota bacterium]